MAEIDPVVTLGSHLGESPMWDPDAGALRWIDIYEPTLNRFDPQTGRNEEITLDQNIHAIAVCQTGGLVGSFEHEIGFVDPETATVTTLVDPIGKVDAKFNDCKCDQDGRFWTGSMSNDWVTPVGCLFRFDGDQTTHTMDTGFKLSNGMGWSADNRTMYFTDFGQSTIFAYDYDANTGGIENRRPFVQIPEGEGKPDGMTVDAEGCLWVALWDGWAVARFDPSGKRVETIELPIMRPTSCMYGGPDLVTMYLTSATMYLTSATMYLTSATMLLTEEELAEQPLAGAVFAIDTGVRGVAEPKFAG